MLSGSYGWIYRQQPAVRSVVDYIADNAAQLGPPKLYERVGDEERRERSDHPAAQALRAPNPTLAGVQFMATVLHDLLVYDNAFVLKLRPPGGDGLQLYPLPADTVGVLGQARFSLDAYRIHYRDGTYLDVAPEDMIHWHGYNPENPLVGVSKLETLRTQLAEESAGQRAQIELAKSGLNQLGHIERPVDAPEWSNEGKERFQEDFANDMKASSRRYPVLEEGMEFKPSQMSPKDAQMLQSREFTREEVARAYGMKHVPPEGEEERLQFYGDVLPPLLDDWCAVLNLQLVGQEFGEDDYYFEVSLDEKLQGDERLKALVSASGAAVLTRNEARSRLNLPPLPEGEGLVTPLNVLVGENPKPSPQIMGPQQPGEPAQDGSAREDMPMGQSANGRHKQIEVTTQPRRVADMARQRRHIDRVTGALLRFYRRQARVERAGKAFDSERWNRELADDLERAFRAVIGAEGGIYVARLGGVDFDDRETKNYVRTMAENAAEDLNRVTQRDYAGDLTAAEAVERAINERAAIAGRNLGTKATVWARREAARQSPGTEGRVQTWVADTERHADLDGITVPLGSDWGGIEPGSEPNCACTAVIS